MKIRQKMIPVYEDTHKALTRLQAQMQLETGERFSYDRLIKHLINEK